MTRIGRPQVKGKVSGYYAGGLIVISCRFDEETFADLSARAERANTSVAQIIREMVEIGLEETDG